MLTTPVLFVTRHKPTMTRAYLTAARMFVHSLISIWNSKNIQETDAVKDNKQQSFQKKKIN